MKKFTRVSGALGVLLLTALSLPAQEASKADAPKKTRLQHVEIGLSYTCKWVKLSETSGSSFTLQGGAVDAAYTLGGKYRGLSFAVDFSGENAIAIKPGVDLSQISVVAGPRYTWKPTRPSKLRYAVYLQSLLGYVHAFDSVFPSNPPSSGTYKPQTTANAFAMQLGGGIGIPLTKHLGIRPAEVDYIYTRLPNNNNNEQSDLRYSAGATWYF